jgi:hypothetical protein
VASGPRAQKSTNASKEKQHIGFQIPSEAQIPKQMDQNFLISLINLELRQRKILAI